MEISDVKLQSIGLPDFTYPIVYQGQQHCFWDLPSLSYKCCQREILSALIRHHVTQEPNKTWSRLVDRWRGTKWAKGWKGVSSYMV